MKKTTMVLLFIIAFILSFPLGFGIRWLNKASIVAEKELDPAILLKRYELFKDQSAALDKFQADISIFESRLQDIKDTYGQPEKWPRSVREERGQISAELAGIKAAYNQLAAQYNANMAKINFAFTNVGELPKGASHPLPREYKPYETK